MTNPSPKAFFVLFCLSAMGISAATAKITQPKQTYQNKVRVPTTGAGFIPQNNIDDPADSTQVYEGDFREASSNPDASARVRHRITLIPSGAVDPLGFDVGSSIRQTGPSALYDKESSVVGGLLTDEARADTVLNDGFLKIAVGQASTNGMDTVTTRVGDRVMQVRFSGEVDNPIPIFSCSISYDVTIRVDGSNKADPRFSISGAHDLFPAYEFYLGKQSAYSYDPRPDRTVLSLCTPSPTSFTPREGGVQ